MQKATSIKIDIVADLHRWRVFLAMGELGSLTRAALFLNSNQSILSRQLNALERECGARLFNRTGRGVELSEVGQHLLPRVKALLGAAEELEADIRGDARQITGRVIIGSLPSIANPLVGRLFTRMREQYPAVLLTILQGSSGRVEEWLSDARLDIAILYRYGATLPEHEQALATVENYLIGAPGDALTKGAEVSFRALHELPLTLPCAPNGLRTAFDNLARQERIKLDPIIEADSLSLMKLLVAQEHLYTVLPLHAVWEEVQEGRLQAAKIVNPGMQRIVSMVTAKSKAPPKAVAAVAAEIGIIVREMAESGMWHPGSVR